MSVVETTQLSGGRTVVTNPVLDRRSVLSLLGVNISSVPVSLDVPIVRCLADGDIFKQNRVYVLRSDHSGYDGVFPSHTHDPNDELNDGGSYYAIRRLNASHLLDFNDQTFLKEKFYVESDETGVVINERLNGSLYVKATSNQVTSVNKAINLFRGGLRLDFSYPFIFKHKVVISHNTNLIYRAGVNMSNIQNTSGPQNQVGIEGCTSSGTQFQVLTGNGTSKSLLALPNSDLAIATPTGYSLEYLPGNQVIFMDARGNTIPKNDNLPLLL